MDIAFYSYIYPESLRTWAPAKGEADEYKNAKYLADVSCFMSFVMLQCICNIQFTV